MNKVFSLIVSALLFLILLSNCRSDGSKKRSTLNADTLSRFNSSEIKQVSKPLTQNDKNIDSIEITTLIRNLYKWHDSEMNHPLTRIVDFPTTATDSFYTGIDWATHQKRLMILENTNFFSKDFIKTYNHIALQIDSFIKINKNKVDIFHIPDFDSDADDWCGCQMYPPNSKYWETIMIKEFVDCGDSASFKWDWIPSRGDLYPVKTKKENNIWKVSFLDGFKSKDYLFRIRY